MNEEKQNDRLEQKVAFYYYPPFLPLPAGKPCHQKNNGSSMTDCNRKRQRDNTYRQRHDTDNIAYSYPTHAIRFRVKLIRVSLQVCTYLFRDMHAVGHFYLYCVKQHTLIEKIPFRVIEPAPFVEVPDGTGDVEPC